MRAGRLFVLLLALSLVGITLIRPESVLPLAFDFVEPLLADPQPAPPPTTDATAKPDAAAAHPDGNLPKFVSGDRTLKFPGIEQTATDATAKPDAQADPKPASASATATAAISASSSTGKDATSAPNAPDGQSEPDATPVSGPKEVTVSPEPKKPDEPLVIGAKNLFGMAKVPAPLAARAIGNYAHGCLSGAVALPIDGPAWQEMRLSRNRNWGHPKLIALVEQFAKDAQKLDGWPGLLVGDIAQPRGGPMVTGHASHQVGLDADIWLTPMPNRKLSNKEREEMEATSMLDTTGVAVDPKIFTEKQVALIKRAASYPEVERIFVHPAIKKALCKAAGTDRKWLGKVRPYWGHYYHFHVRIKCPAGFGGCVPQVPPTGDDGCGKEVDQWLAKVVPAKTPATPAPPPPPGYKASPSKPPIMLSELPSECRAVLAAGPDPVPVPKEALITSAAARQILIKAAAAKAKLEKLAVAPGKSTLSGAAAAAAGPALDPHAHDTVAIDKK